jgi:ATP-dependent Lhr-like helicase
VLLGRTRHLDHVRLPDAPLDILAQQLVSMGCNGPWERREALEFVRGAYPYAKLSKCEFDDVLDYLSGGGEALREQYSEVFGKIDLDENQFRTRAGRVQRDFLQNVGVIPDVGAVRVHLKSKTLGSVEESFLRMLQPGDVFIIAGRSVRLERVDQMEAFVERADGTLPTVPRWNANKMPLSNNVAEEITRFRSELRSRFEKEPSADHSPWIAKRLDCGMSNARIIEKMFSAQHAVSEIPTGDYLLVESFREIFAHARISNLPQHARHYFFHSLIGRSANDALARVVTRRLNRIRGGNAVAISHDYGFVLSVSDAQQVDEGDLPELMSPEDFDADLEEALSRSEMLKYHFRNAAQTGLMVYRNYFGQHKPVRKLQWSTEVIFNVLQQYEPDHVLMREARRDAMQVFVHADAARAYLQRAAHEPMRLREVVHIPPLSFAMFATKIREALLVEDPAETMERLFNLWWNDLREG